MSYDHKDLVQYESRQILEASGFKYEGNGLYKKQRNEPPKVQTIKKVSIVEKIKNIFKGKR